jgi:hypothetical protein
VETLVVGILSLLAGAGIKTWFDRFQATWFKHRDAAAEAYGAVVAVHSAVMPAYQYARRVDATIRANHADIGYIADHCTWILDGHIDSSMPRLDRLREARRPGLLWARALAVVGEREVRQVSNVEPTAYRPAG